MRSLAIWLSWADFLEYHTGELAKAITAHYQSITTYLPLDWHDFDAVLAVPGPNQDEDCCTERFVKVAWERLELGWAARSGRMIVSCLPSLELARGKRLDPTLLHWGVNPAHFAPRPVTGRIVGWCGRYLNPRKQYPSVEAAFAGMDFRPNLSWMESGRQVGPYDLPGLAEYYAGIDVLVCGSMYEGFSFPMLEAAAVGRGIVTFDVGIARDLLDTGAGVVIVGSFEEMVDAVRDSDLVELGRRSAEAVLEHWTWDSLKEKWIDAIDSVG